MKTTTDKMLRRQACSALLVFLLAGSMLAASDARSGQDEPRFYLGAAVGCFYPLQDPFRKIYDRAAWPLELELQWQLNRKISLFAAGRYLETTGRTVLLDPQGPEEAYALRWRMATLRLGAEYFFNGSRLVPFLGAGLSVSYFREKWLDAALETQGRKTGFFAQAGARYSLGRRWHALARLEYSLSPAGNGPAGKVDLGGLSLMLGLAMGIL